MEKWITFDLDGTLMQNPFSKWVFPEIATNIQAGSKSEKDIQKLIINEHELRMSEKKVVQAYDWDDIVESVLSNMNIPEKVDVESIVKKHSFKPKIYLLEEEIIDNLEGLKNIGYNLAVLTNGYSKYQLPVMKELGLECVFDEIITPDICGYAKPNVGMVQSLNGEGEVVAHVGDRIDHDIIMANQLGITSFFINRELPQYIEKVPVHKRNRCENILSICKDKWESENSLISIPFQNDCIPDIVVSSLEELLNYFISINS
ncbi:FMN phosphatase YigB (HAD superfamily) [Virgibacillus halotolerans]|uniref:HAD family hydrolase n=1 Tax=Virgibacillus halotolerans TaxID=1071053 RepID=UPI0019603207|nr:HAD family hydrolase [Virgibacillus halotolerans]MBM7601906.1 FMN phosphatase YigB (HAD superfamily) [Virgibacillus halotolerans]